MRFLIDESADARLAALLAARGHDAILVAQRYHPGLTDVEVLDIARTEGRILITDDRDFSELVFLQGEAHGGVIYFRLRSTLLSTRLAPLANVLDRHAGDLDEFVVVTDHQVRVRRRTA